jgi:protein-S-isoprenylcysteine O-methyltransferase Ste14
VPPFVTPTRSATIQTSAFILLLAAVLFGAAGEIDIAAFWGYVAVVAVASGVGLLLIDRDLAQERMRPGGRRPGARFLFIMLLLLAHWAAAGLDRGRLHWSDAVPPALQLAGLVLFAIAWSAIVWAMHVNRFFSSVARIQRERGHRLIDGGPYRWLRHPGYSAAIVAALASGVALGSWLAAAVGTLGVPLLLWRTIIEDRLLRAELPGYREYAKRVPSRLMPGLW